MAEQYNHYLYLNLNYDESQILKEEGIFLGEPTNGRRRVSAAILSPPTVTTDEDGSEPSSTPAHVQIEAFDPSPLASIELPEIAESVAALEFIGYTNKTAEEVYKNWMARPNPGQCPDSLIRYATSHTGWLNSSFYTDLEAPQAMTKFGIASELQAILLDPEFAQIFKSASLIFWLNDTFKTRYSCLVWLLEQLQFRAKRAIAKRKEKNRPKTASLSNLRSSPSSAPQTYSSGGAALYADSDDDSLSNAYKIRPAQPALPGHYILYKAIMVGDPGEKRILRRNGELSKSRIDTRDGGDFNHQDNAFYFTKEKDTAELYRRWGAIRCQWSTSWLVTIQVPKALMNSLRQQSLFFSPDWKEYTWHCHRRGWGNMPAKFDKYFESNQVDMVEGHILGRSPNFNPKIKSEEVQQKISESDVIQIHGVKCTQVVFHQHSIDRLVHATRGKINIEIHKPIVFIEETSAPTRISQLRSQRRSRGPVSVA